MVCPHPCTCGKNQLCADKVSDYIIIIMNTVYTRMYVHHVISSFEYYGALQHVVHAAQVM